MKLDQFNFAISGVHTSPTYIIESWKEEIRAPANWSEIVTTKIPWQAKFVFYKAKTPCVLLRTEMSETSGVVIKWRFCDVYARKDK